MRVTNSSDVATGTVGSRSGRGIAIIVAAIALVGAAGASLWFAGSQRQAREPDIVLVTLDTLRADRLGSYGGPALTPHIDVLASEGVLFENAVSPIPSTLPAHLSIFTSRYPRQLGVLDNETPLGADETTLAQVLRDRGYATAGFVSAAVLNKASGAARGFDTFDSPQQYAQRGAQVSMPRALQWLAQGNRTKPIFLWVHLYDPHMPYNPPKPFAPPGTPWSTTLPMFSWPALLEVAQSSGGTLPASGLEYALALYQGEVRKTDKWVGKLTDALRERGTLDRTILVVTADHGECFENGAYFEHSPCLYDGAVRVPLFIRYPAAVPAGVRRRVPVEHVDLAPTILTLAGLPAAPSFSGNPLFGNGRQRKTHVFVQHPRYSPQAITLLQTRRQRLKQVAGNTTMPVMASSDQYAVRNARWKYLITEHSEELYAIRTDAKEEHDVASEQPKILQQMRDALKTWREKYPAVEPTAAPLDPATAETLRKLGYH